MKETTKYRIKAVGHIGFTAIVAPALLVSVGPFKTVKICKDIVNSSVSMINRCNELDNSNAEFSVVEES